LDIQFAYLAVDAEHAARSVHKRMKNRVQASPMRYCVLCGADCVKRLQRSQNCAGNAASISARRFRHTRDCILKNIPYIQELSAVVSISAVPRAILIYFQLHAKLLEAM
jgi:hypothetical protein